MLFALPLSLLLTLAAAPALPVLVVNVSWVYSMRLREASRDAIAAIALCRPWLSGSVWSVLGFAIRLGMIGCPESGAYEDSGM